MDYQQERLDLDKAWFAGVFEGEGSFSLSVNRRIERGKDKIRFFPFCCLTNSDVTMINEIERILMLHEIKYYKAFRGKRHEHYKNLWHIQIGGMTRCIEFITWILPFIRGEKKLKAEKLLNLCKIRMAKMTKFWGVPYSDDDIQLINEIRGMQKSGILNDFTSNTEK
jgi:hypothetical protein